MSNINAPFTVDLDPEYKYGSGTIASDTKDVTINDTVTLNGLVTEHTGMHAKAEYQGPAQVGKE